MPDLNLLVTLDAILSEGSVARAARRLRLSPSAMSRSLARLREVMGDPLLVRAGRSLVPTPRAVELRSQVAPLLREAQAVLGPTKPPPLAAVSRQFTIRARDGFVETFGAALIDRVRAEAPGIRLRFLQKLNKDSEPLREGSVDLEVGVIGGSTGPEVRTREVFRDRWVGVVRRGHPLARGALTAVRYAAASHVLVALKENKVGPVEEALEALGLEREISVTVSGYSAAIGLVRASDVVATVPERCTAGLREGVLALPLPLELPKIPISLQWHPRMEADPVHRWLRQQAIHVLSAGD